MSRLARIREEMRRSIRIPREKREAVARVLAEVLSRHNEILLAALFGGITVEDKPVRDIDVAIYTGYGVDPGELPYYADKLRGELEKELEEKLGLRKAVDVVPLEMVPPALRVNALKGRILVEWTPGLRGALLLHAYEEIRAMERRSRQTGTQGW